ncbi:(2Fe-2S)-binding protein [candidate division WOR-3 bacterium]|nr:(2Fe-2S)-binding protein [candidate division WOR-3 bacterium]
MFTINVDGRDIGADEGETIIEAANRAGIKIPTLCYHEAVSPFGACRLCSVEVLTGGKPKVVQSCIFKAKPGLIVKTKSPTVMKLRKEMLEKILGDGFEQEEINRLAEKESLEEVGFPKGDSVCRVCGLCIRVCKEISEAKAIKFEGKGKEKRVVPVTADVSNICIGCGGCTYLCPTGNIRIDGEYIVLKDTKLAKLNEFQKKEKVTT